jgi:DNA-binding winged helix-turn-helix (wHTH) protein
LGSRRIFWHGSGEKQQSPSSTFHFQLPINLQSSSSSRSIREFVRQCLIITMDSPRFRFGLFEFDSATRELHREGLLIRLQFQPALVLATLIERHGQVVSREDLHQTLWGGETFVDFERGLNFCISQIRAALNDDSTEPTFIRTIPKHGYQFIAPRGKCMRFLDFNPRGEWSSFTGEL